MTLFRSDKVQAVPFEGQTYYCCLPRGATEDVCDRPPISTQRATSLAHQFAVQRAGGHTTFDQLCEIAGPVGGRAFCIGRGGVFCTCPAFSHPRQCLHTLGLEVFLGKRDLPDWVDDVPLALSARGNKPKAPGRGAVPITADEKDRLIAQLQAQVCKLAKQALPNLNPAQRRRTVRPTPGALVDGAQQPCPSAPAQRC